MHTPQHIRATAQDPRSEDAKAYQQNDTVEKHKCNNPRAGALSMTGKKKKNSHNAECSPRGENGRSGYVRRPVSLELVVLLAQVGEEVNVLLHVNHHLINN